MLRFELALAFENRSRNIQDMPRAFAHLCAPLLAALVFTACRHTSELPFRQHEPKIRQPAEEIRQKIVGLWTVDQDANGPEPFLSLNLQATGDFSAASVRRLKTGGTGQLTNPRSCAKPANGVQTRV